MLKKKPYIEEHKRTAEKQLAERVAALQSKGKAERDIQRDAAVRHFRGKIRQAAYRLAEIADVERQMARKAEIKAEKLAQPKVEPPKKRHSADPGKKKVKKERKPAAEAEE